MIRFVSRRLKSESNKRGKKRATKNIINVYEGATVLIDVNNESVDGMMACIFFAAVLPD